MRDDKKKCVQAEEELEALRHKVSELEQALQDRRVRDARSDSLDDLSRQIFYNIGQGVAVYEAVDNGRDFVFKDINKSSERIERLRRDAVVGRSVQDVFPGVKEFGLFEVFQRVWKTGKPEHHPVSRYKDHRITGWRDNYVFKLPGGEIVAVYDDVTREKQYEERLKIISKAVEQSPVTVVITDHEARIEYVNPKFTELTGYTLDEVLGENPRVFKSGSMSPDFYENLWKTIASGKDWSGEFLNKKKNGELYWEEANILPVKNSDGAITNYVAIKTDVTEKKKMWGELVTSKEKAEEGERLKSCFLANISHEIRTPMNGILGFSTLLKEPRLSGEEREQYIELIHESGKRMLSIINNLIDISRIEAGELTLSPITANLNEIIEHIHDSFAEQATEKGLSFTAEKGLTNEESLIVIDEVRIIQILSHLLGNAIKYTDSGTVSFGYRKTGDMLEFSVKDTGIGIPWEHQSTIFERFRKVSLDVTGADQGAGLGLSLSKKFVEMMGGTMRLESTPGKGSHFTFTIPFKGFLKSKAKQGKDGSEKLYAFPPGFTILVVDDDSISRLLLKGVLSGQQVEVILAENGKEAVEKIKKEPSIRVVLMDMKMPVMNGYEATSRIKEIRPDLPVIAQTAFADPGERETAKKAGCDVVLAKPINPQQMLHEIQRHI